MVIWAEPQPGFGVVMLMAMPVIDKSDIPGAPKDERDRLLCRK